LATAVIRPYAWGFLKGRVYNPRKLEDLKHNRLLQAMTKRIFKKLQKSLLKGLMIIFKKVGDIFSICSIIRCYHILRIKKIKINGLKYSVTFYTVHILYRPL
jgi:hypothetical protein